ncbi:MAG: molybdopterin-dependent oxidoreductase [Anaerolineales bacterium]|nr:molybdopterin-dependent oxidoreductase [Anaerolineales bacterium]
MSQSGESVKRLDAIGKVTGKTLFPGDINLPNQTMMKILFANRPHAIVRSIDTSQAEAIPGVIAVLTAKDVPVNEYGLGVFDQPVLCGPGSNKPYADRVRFIGDQVALVIAETEAIASRARDLIVVEYEELPVVTDPELAMKPDALLLHPERDSNVFCHHRIRKGDIESGFTQADVIVEGEYHTPSQEHAYLEPEAGLGYIDEEGRVTVQVAGQWAHEDQEQIAHALDLPLDRVRVIYPAIGGAFGGREDMSVQIVLALAALKMHEQGINRPVKIIWSREESIIGHHKRHPFIIRTRWGATKEGKITAVEVEMIADGGGYVYTSPKVLGNATLLCSGVYEVPNVKVDAYGVYTNNIPNGAFRGFGGPQAAFAAETQMNRLAEKLNMDAFELRMRNIFKEGSILSVGTPLPPGVSMPQVVKACAEAGGWVETEQGWKAGYDKKSEALRPASDSIKTGKGFACSYKNIGFSYGAPEHCWATVEIHGEEDIDQVVVYHAGADVGQGAHTVFAQMAAKAIGVPIEKVKLVVSDTAVTDNSGSTSASRLTFMAGNSIKGACEEALEMWKAEERPAIASYKYRSPRTTPFDPETGFCEPNFAYGYVAQVARVAVDTETGHVRVLDVISADDVGYAINPQQVKGQIEGAVVQATGYTILENFIQKEGYVQTQHLSTYLIPTVLDVPENVQSLILEYPDPRGPWGARGMAEMPFLPYAPAIIAAVHDAIGIWFHEFPLTPEKILRALGKLPVK